jgi:choline dehydrogenase-like flavoprotein
LRSGVTGYVGEGVQFHSSIHVTARFDEPVFGYYGPTMAYAITEFSDVHGHDGPGFMLENTAVHPVATASALPGFGDAHARRMGELPHLARALVVLRDRTRGRITLGDAGAARVDHTLIEDDRRRLAEGMVAIARAFLAAGASEVILPIEGSPSIRSERDLSPFDGAVFEPARASLLYAVHLFGGACMGGRPESSVCDADGRVRGVRGVFVSDASALPTNLGANPQVTIVANALRIATRILDMRGASAATHRKAASQRHARSATNVAAEIA